MAEPNPERRRVRKLTKRKRTDDAEDSDGATLLLSPYLADARVVRWLLGEGAAFEKGAVLAKIKVPDAAAGSGSATTSPEEEEDVIAPEDGTLVRIIVRSGDPNPGPVEALARVKLCTHPAVVSNLCAVCGRLMPQAESTAPKHHLVTLAGTVSDLRVDAFEAKARSRIARLKAARKLQLVLDIDNTLLECSATAPEEAPGLRRIALYGGTRPHWLKLRPGVESFLDTAAAKFEMTLYTNGEARASRHACRRAVPCPLPSQPLLLQGSGSTRCRLPRRSTRRGGCSATVLSPRRTTCQT